MDSQYCYNFFKSKAIPEPSSLSQDIFIVVKRVVEIGHGLVVELVEATSSRSISTLHMAGEQVLKFFCLCCFMTNNSDTISQLFFIHLSSPLQQIEQSAGCPGWIITYIILHLWKMNGTGRRTWRQEGASHKKMGKTRTVALTCTQKGGEAKKKFSEILSGCLHFWTF